METNPLVRLMNSSKAIVALLVIVLSFAALFTGKVAWEQMNQMVQWVLAVWLGAQGLEDAAKHIGQPKLTSESKDAVKVILEPMVQEAVSKSLPPPPADK